MSFIKFYRPIKKTRGVWANQDAWFHLGDFTKGKSDEYKIKKEGNGIYAFVLEGDVEIEGEQLNKRDGIGIWDTSSIKVQANENARVLLMEIPMSI